MNHSSRMQAVKFQYLALQSQSQSLTSQHSFGTWAWLSTNYNLVIVKGVGFTRTILRVGLHKNPKPSDPIGRERIFGSREFTLRSRFKV